MNLQCPARLVVVGPSADPRALAAVLADRRIAQVYVPAVHADSAGSKTAEALAGALGVPLQQLPDYSAESLGDLHRGETVVLVADRAGFPPGAEFEHDGNGWSRVPAMDPNAVTLATYEQTAERFRDSIRQGAGEDHPLIELAASVLEPGATVLELGSGTGVDALLLEAEGYRVRRTDGAASFVEMMRADGHQADRLNAITDDLGGPYDLVFADAVFLHFGPDQLETVLRKAAQAARRLVFSLREGDGAEWSMRHLDLPRHITLWHEDALRDLLTETGWTTLSVTRWVTPVGPWMLVLARS